MDQSKNNFNNDPNFYQNIDQNLDQNIDQNLSQTPYNLPQNLDLETITSVLNIPNAFKDSFTRMVHASPSKVQRLMSSLMSVSQPFNCSNSEQSISDVLLSSNKLGPQYRPTRYETEQSSEGGTTSQNAMPSGLESQPFHSQTNNFPPNLFEQILKKPDSVQSALQQLQTLHPQLAGFILPLIPKDIFEVKSGTNIELNNQNGGQNGGLQNNGINNFNQINPNLHPTFSQNSIQNQNIPSLHTLNSNKPAESRQPNPIIIENQQMHGSQVKLQPNHLNFTQQSPYHFQTPNISSGYQKPSHFLKPENSIKSNTSSQSSYQKPASPYYLVPNNPLTGLNPKKSSSKLSFSQKSQKSQESTSQKSQNSTYYSTNYSSLSTSNTNHYVVNTSSFPSKLANPETFNKPSSMPPALPLHPPNINSSTVSTSISLVSAPQSNCISPITRKRKKGPAPKLNGREPCSICGDYASGFHYNVLTCEGCKGFFRRSVTKKATYKCKYEKKCNLNVSGRRKCQSCRFRKCLQSGMRAYLVNSSDAETKRKRKEHLDEFLQELKVPLEKQEKIKFSGKVFEENEFPSEAEVLSVTAWDRSDSESGLATRFCHFAEMAIIVVKRVANFCKELPEFKNISHNDQTALLKEGMIEQLFLRASFQYNMQDKTINFVNDHRYSKVCFFNAGMRLDFVNPIFEFCECMSKYFVVRDKVLVGLLSALVLFCPDRDGLEDRGKIENIQLMVLDLLRLYCRSSRMENPLLFPQILTQISDLRKLGFLHNEYVFSIGPQSNVNLIQAFPLLADLWQKNIGTD